MPNIHIITQFYNDANSKRDQELQYCLLKNLENLYVEKVHLLLEDFTTIPDAFIGNPKLIIKTIESKRLTFQIALLYAEACEQINPMDAIVLTNSDIFLDHNSPWNDIFSVFETNPGKVSFHLSRHEINKEGSVWFEKGMNGSSQDAWIFQKMPANLPIIAKKVLDMMTYCVGGAPYCDGYTTYLLKQEGQFDVYNWALKFKIFHYDRCRGHSFGTIVFNAKTDFIASDIVHGNSFINTRTTVCPFVDYDLFFSNKNILPLNHVSTCCVEFSHTHNEKNEIVVDKKQLENDYKAIICGICDPSITKEELVRNMGGIAKEMIYREIYFDYIEYFKQQFIHCNHSNNYGPIDDFIAIFPDAAAVYANWGWNIRHSEGMEKAYALLKKSLQFTFTKDCKFQEHYEYKRFHYLGVVSFYVKEYETGYMAAKTAFDAKNLDIDKTNMKYYPL